MKLDITALLAGKVRVLPFRYEIAGGGDDLPMPPAGVTLTSPIRVEGKISDSGTCLYLVLDAAADYEAPCDRCGEAVRSTVSCHLERMVAEAGAVDDEDEDYFVACEGELDLDADVAEELMLSFPSQILCREGCLGVCPVCGQNRNKGDCGCAAKEAERVDPRWQALERLLKEQNDKNE